MKRISKQRIVMLFVLAVFVALVVITFRTPGSVAELETYQPDTYATPFALLPPVIAIGLALITKEVYSSLFIGILTGGLLYANFNLELMLQTIFFHEKGGMIYKLADSWNVGILVFLVVLGILVAAMNKAGGSAAPAANKTSYTAAEALELYKSAANKVKTTAKSATRTSETIRTISGSIPSLYSSFGFKEGTKTEKVVANGSSELKDKFPVEKKSYTCNLSASDIKSATVQNNGSSKVVTIVVKDDNPGTYSNSSKCVSTISIPIGTWTCKGVTLRGTIDANGRLTSLYYKMPTYVTQGSDAFAFSLEQNWTVAY